MAEVAGDIILLAAFAISLSGSIEFEATPLPPPGAPPEAPPFGPLASPPPPYSPDPLPCLEGRMLRATSSSGSGGGKTTTSGASGVQEEMQFAPFGYADVELLNVMWALLSVGLLLRVVCTSRMLYIPFESMNIFVITVGKILFNDIAIFLILFFNFCLAAYLVLYIIYPRANGFYDVGFVTAFNSWNRAFMSIVHLAFLGVNFELNLDSSLNEPLSPWQEIDLALFVLIYFGFILFAIILLLNLLVATLANTFDDVREESTLMCRLSFARYMLRCESFAGLLGFNCRVGKATGDGRYVYEFRNIEGSGNGGDTDDPFSSNDDDSVSLTDAKNLADINRQLRALREQRIRQQEEVRPSTRGGERWARLSHELPVSPKLLKDHPSCSQVAAPKSASLPSRL